MGRPGWGGGLGLARPRGLGACHSSASEAALLQDRRGKGTSGDRSSCVDCLRHEGPGGGGGGWSLPRFLPLLPAAQLSVDEPVISRNLYP